MKNSKIKIFIFSFFIFFFIPFLCWDQDGEEDGEVTVKLKEGKIIIRALPRSPVEAGEILMTTLIIENNTRKPLKLDVRYEVIPKFKKDRKYKKVLGLPPESNRKFILKAKINRLAYRGYYYNLNFQLIGRGIKKEFSTHFEVEDSHNDDEIPFQKVDLGCYGNRENKRRLVIKNQEELDAFLIEDNPILTEPCNEIPPEINFEEDMLIGVFMGRKATGRYEIEIKKISKNEKGQLEVSVIEYSPGFQCIVPETETTPFEIIKVKRSEDEVVFSEKEITYSCD